MDKHSEQYKAYRREIARKNRDQHYEKIFARSVIKNLPKLPCEYCLKEGITNMITEGHHDDYLKPYDVRWLCKKHHELVDTELARRKKQNDTLPMEEKTDG